MPLGGKRELLAGCMRRSGVAFLLERLPRRDLLLVINHHRIGNDGGKFGPSGFTASAEELDEQVAWLKRRLPVVGLDEAIDSVAPGGRKGPRGCRVLITFDDGYRDNYETAFPILRSHGVPGAFFLVTGFTGGGQVPWWDRIAYLLHTAGKRQFTLRYPEPLEIDMDRDGGPRSLRRILDSYKRPANADGVRFLCELEEVSQGKLPPASDRLFLNWDEAREMLRAGMGIGSHTHTHPVLSQLPPAAQRAELARSRQIVENELAIRCDTLAYPVGNRDSYTGETCAIARETGYRAAFSFHGGANSVVHFGELRSFARHRRAANSGAVPRPDRHVRRHRPVLALKANAERRRQSPPRRQYRRPIRIALTVRSNVKPARAIPFCEEIFSRVV